MIKETLEKIKNQAIEELGEIGSVEALESFRVKYLGKKGSLTSVLKSMGSLSPEERPIVGQRANEVRAAIEEKLEEARVNLAQKFENMKLASETIDVTMPGRIAPLGKKHPLTTVLDDLKDIFIGMGYSIAEGPDVELDYYNFEALNLPPDHPARDTQDTFYINDSVLLRTQTSPVQIRYMEQHKPPIRIIAPGRVFRSDSVDATHSPVFHQIEGLVVDKGITMANLKGTLETFVHKLYGEDTRLRFRTTSRLPSRARRLTSPASTAAARAAAFARAKAG